MLEKMEILNRNVLYSFRRCPYAMRARLAIANSTIKVELREVVLKNKPQTLRDISPKATVPVLLTADKTVIDESLDIMLWALNQSDPDNWLSDINNELIANNDGEFKHWLDRYKYADRYPEQSEYYYRQQAEKMLVILEQQLAENGCLVSAKLSLTDMAIFPFIRQFAFVDKAWFDSTPYPHVKTWLTSLIDSSLFRTIMVKYPAWQQGDELILLPH
ncbi:MAG: glutathione S-transferase [Methylophagaceae bacterium]